MSWNWLQFQFEPKVGKNRTEPDLQTLVPGGDLRGLDNIFELPPSECVAQHEVYQGQ
jgi:hypothetical protein